MEDNLIGCKTLLLSPLKAGSGNRTTADRIACYFRNDAGNSCSLRDPRDFKDVNEFKRHVEEEDYHLVVAIHAKHCKDLLLACDVPYILVFGGTDVNCHDKSCADKISQVLQRARHVVGFTEQLIEKAEQLWGIPKQSMKLIPQGVSVCPSDYDFTHAVLRDVRNKMEGPLDLEFFTLVAGIRPVKNPLFLVNQFSDWHIRERSNAYLVIIGNILDEEYGQIFLSSITNLPGVVYLGGLSVADCHAAMRASVAVVNSSESEGMSAALLEALCVGTAVVARRIPGNEAVITHDHTGLLYDTPQEFIFEASRLLSEPRLRQRLCEQGYHHVMSAHSCEKERRAYHKLRADVTQSLH